MLSKSSSYRYSNFHTLNPPFLSFLRHSINSWFRLSDISGVNRINLGHITTAGVVMAVLSLLLQKLIIHIHHQSLSIHAVVVMLGVLVLSQVCNVLTIFLIQGLCVQGHEITRRFLGSDIRRTKAFRNDWWLENMSQHYGASFVELGSLINVFFICSFLRFLQV